MTMSSANRLTGGLSALSEPAETVDDQRQKLVSRCPTMDERNRQDSVDQYEIDATIASILKLLFCSSALNTDSAAERRSLLS